MEYFSSQLAARLRKQGKETVSWLFQVGPVLDDGALDPAENDSDVDDDVPLGLLYATSSLWDFAFIDPDSDTELEHRPGVALWADGGLTYTSPALLRESADSQACQMLDDIVQAYAIWLEERPTLRVMLRYRASVQLQVAKMFVCHFGKTPRSEKKGTGLITVAAFMNEVVWEHGGDAYIDASGQHVPTRGVQQLVDGTKRVVRYRDQAKLGWLNVEDVDGPNVWPSVHKYYFNTAIALGRLLPLHMLLLPIPHSDFEAKCPLPSGYLRRACDADWSRHAEQPADLVDQLAAGDPGFIIGYR